MEKNIDDFDEKFTEKSTFLYDELLKNTIIPEIKHESTKISLTELGKIKDHFTHVVEKLT